jgi:hypothetical protein
MYKYSWWVYIIYLVIMIALIVGADYFIFRYHFWARLLINIAIVLAFAAVYLRFMK